MKNILTIFKKEFKDTIRDRRTLLTMIFVPLVFLPVILSFTAKIVSSQADKAKDKDLKIGLVTNGNGAELVKRFQRCKDLEVFEISNSREFNTLIRQDSLDIALEISSDFDRQTEQGETADLTVFYNSTDESAIYNRVNKTIMEYKILYCKIG